MKIVFAVIASLILSFNAFGNNKNIVRITKGNMDPLKISLTQMNSFDEELSDKIINVIKNDLERSGFFKVISSNKFLENLIGSEKSPNFVVWRQIDSSFVFTADLIPIENDKIKLSFKLWDSYNEKQVNSAHMTISKSSWRRVAHIAADKIYNTILGEGAYFNSKIIYVEETGPATKRIKKLAIMDQDGANHQYITDGSFMVLTPRFSPNSQKVIYLSYIGASPKVYLLDLITGENRLIGKFPGMSYAPKFSPNGKFAVMSVAMSGRSNIYMLNLNDFSKTKITNNKAINTSPSFSPDGKKITYTSDRGGNNQIYVMKANGTESKRISFGKGTYATPSWSPRGDFIAFTKIKKGKFYIGIMRPNGKGERILSEGFLVEGPSWSPNGRVIIYSRTKAGRNGKPDKSTLHSIDVTGYFDQEIKTINDATDPSWSPLIQ